MSNNPLHNNKRFAAETLPDTDLIFELEEKKELALELTGYLDINMRAASQADWLKAKELLQDLVNTLKKDTMTFSKKLTQGQTALAQTKNRIHQLASYQAALLGTDLDGNNDLANVFKTAKKIEKTSYHFRTESENLKRSLETEQRTLERHESNNKYFAKQLEADLIQLNKNELYLSKVQYHLKHFERLKKRN